jgi:HK97 gp10 family phage protein
MPAFGTVEVRYNKVPQLSGNLKKLAKETVEGAALNTEGIAKSLIPVDTGAGRNSIQAMKGETDLTWVVGVGVEYGIYLEYGTSRMPAHPFMTPAVEIVRPQFLSAMGEIVEQAAR